MSLKIYWKLEIGNWKFTRGFTLIEILITIGVVGVLGVGLWSAWVIGLQVTSEKRAEVTASALATERLERIKSLSYDQVGTVGGIPSGAIIANETITRNQITYTIRTSIFYIDDPFDTLAPEDLIPTDYKRVRVETIWSGKFGVSPVVLMTDIAPKALETNVGGGTMLIRVIDTALQPVAQATVTIANDRVVPPIALTRTTDSEGRVMIPGAPASQEGYDITVTKDGYGADGTERPTVGINPSPVKPPLSVMEGQLLETGFTIDRLATLTITTVDNRGSREWWRSLFPYRMHITFTNNGTTDAPAGTAVAIDFDHATLVKIGRSLANGNDVRVVFWNGTYFEELDRIATTGWNDKKTRLWFATKKIIKKNESDQNYALYYGNLSADIPLASPSRIFPPPIQADTVGLWYLDDGKGSLTARDSSGNGHDGELRALDPETVWVQGQFGNAIIFNKTDTTFPYVYVAPTETLKNIQTFTIEAWIKPTDLGGSHIIVSKAINSKQKGKFNFSTYYKSLCLFVWKDVNPYDGTGCGGTLTANVWQHVAATFDGRYIKTYVNGALVGTVEKPGNLIQNENIELNIGRYAANNWQFFTGTIDNVALHRSVRTDFSYGRKTNINALMSPEQWYQEPNALANVTVTITSEKVIGTDDAGKPIPRFTLTKKTNPIGQIILNAIEADTYSFIIDGATTGYDIAATLPLTPRTVAPASTAQEQLTLVPHRSDTLLVTVKDRTMPLDGASVQLTNETIAYDTTIVTGESGQAFFSPLTADTTYDVSVTKPGYTSTTTTARINGQTYEEIPLAPL